MYYSFVLVISSSSKRNFHSLSIFLIFQGLSFPVELISTRTFIWCTIHNWYYWFGKLCTMLFSRIHTYIHTYLHAYVVVVVCPCCWQCLLKAPIARAPLSASSFKTAANFLFCLDFILLFHPLHSRRVRAFFTYLLRPLKIY